MTPSQQAFIQTYTPEHWQISTSPLMLGADLPNRAVLQAHQPDAHWQIIDPASGKPQSQLSLWWTETPSLPNERVGVIGHYAATTHQEDGVALLQAACQYLANQGCTVALGPMDGNTWRSYRFITQAGHEPPFFLEMQHPHSYPGQWEAAGFTPFSRYVSAVASVQGNHGPLPHLPSHGPSLTIRPLDATAWEKELTAIHQLSLQAFTRNVLYTPLPLSAFLAQYHPLQAVLRPELVLLAEHDQQLVGYLVGVPNQLANAGPSTDTVIFKTMARHPSPQYKGLGNRLFVQLHQQVHALGYRRVIHAFMHQANASLQLSQRVGGHVMREYTLFQKRLTAA